MGSFGSSEGLIHFVQLFLVNQKRRSFWRSVVETCHDMFTPTPDIRVCDDASRLCKSLQQSKSDIGSYQLQIHGSFGNDSKETLEAKSCTVVTPQSRSRWS